jgi:hypothetical protein
MPRAPKPTDAPAGTVWFGGEVERVSLCFRVCSDALDPDEVTELLGRPPSSSQRKGQEVLGPNGEVRRVGRTGSWVLRYAIDPKLTLAEGITSFVSTLPEDQVIWASLTSRFRVDLICDVFVRGMNQGFELPPSVLKMMGERGIILGVDIFCESDTEQADQLAKNIGQNG